jgi:hypothetical protein
METGKTIAECIELCGDFPSDKTVEKVFLKGSEEKSFRESTIAAIELACLGKVYSPEIKIPVEDVTRTIEDAVKPLADENRLLKHTVNQHKQMINSLVRLCITAVLLIISIGIYDFNTPGVGFWGSHLSWVFLLKIAFGIYAAVVVIRHVFLLRKLKADFEAEEKKNAEAIV